MNLFEISVDQHMDMIEYAGNMLDNHDLIDSSAPSLIEVGFIAFVAMIYCNATP